MQAILQQFTSRGWHHTQLFRKGTIAVFKRWKDGGLPPHFETVRIRENADYEVHGNFIPAHESYPGDTSWGQHGWTFDTEEQAMAKAQELLNPPAPLRRIKKILAS